jgi:hypothetical protein
LSRSRGGWSLICNYLDAGVIPKGAVFKDQVIGNQRWRMSPLNAMAIRLT